MPTDNSSPAPTSATPDALAALFAEEFEEFANTEFARKAVRASISGKVKRRSLLHLGYAHGCKTGASAAGLVYRAILARALGSRPDTGWDELTAAVRALVDADAIARMAKDPAYRSVEGGVECAEHGSSFTEGCWPCLEVCELEHGGRGFRVRLRPETAREECSLCARPIFSVRMAIAETDLPENMSSADAVRELWRRLQSSGAGS